MNGVVLIDPAPAGASRQFYPPAAEFDDGYRMLVELLPEAIWINCGGQVAYANPAAKRLFGATDAAQLAGIDALIRLPHDPRHRMTQLRRVDGTLVDVEYFGCPVRFNSCESVLNMAHDVTERREHDQAIEHQATHDLLTGLPNRALFLDRLALAIRRAERHRGRLAVMFVDLDKFKHVNDTLGHAAGDQLLRTVGTRLAQCVREADTVARLGGDEFVLLLDHPLGENTPALVAERVAGRLGEPVTLGGHEHVVTGSIGISMYPDDGFQAEELLRQADLAMYRAKEGGRNGFQFFTHDMQSRLDARMMLEQGLHRALQRDEFVLHSFT